MTTKKKEYGAQCVPQDTEKKPPTEDYKFLTVTFREKRNKIWLQWATTWPKIQIRLNRCSDNYKFWPELTENNDLHYHGIIYKITDKKYYRTGLLTYLKSKGFIKVVKIINHDKCLAYCSKDEKLMKDILEVDLPFTQKSHHTIATTEWIDGF